MPNPAAARAQADHLQALRRDHEHQAVVVAQDVFEQDRASGHVRQRKRRDRRRRADRFEALGVAHQGQPFDERRDAPLAVGDCRAQRVPFHVGHPVLVHAQSVES